MTNRRKDGRLYTDATTISPVCDDKGEIVKNIFEPFFTTKEIGRGTGLGLATVYGIVKQNNGFINVSSEPGNGTTFKLYLPRHAEDESKTAPPIAAPIAVSRGETVLLVEDEPELLQMGKIMLELLGYRVLPANSPGEALAIAGRCRDQPDLLLTDVVMPGMNGRELAGQLLQLFPQLKCLFMSGYTANVIAHHGVLNEDIHFIQKPFSHKDLVAKLYREVHMLGHDCVGSSHKKKILIGDLRARMASLEEVLGSERQSYLREKRQLKEEISSLAMERDGHAAAHAAMVRTRAR